MPHKITFLVVCAGLLLRSPDAGLAEAFHSRTVLEAPAWGYLYAFRTLRLYPLVEAESGIGRLTENEVVLTSPRVSRRHAAVRRAEGGATFLDVGSSNGSRVNGREVRAREPVPIAPGDVVQLADEPLLFHASLAELWRDELRHRLLAGIVRLNLHLPQDERRNTFGREEIVPAITEARIRTDAQKVDVEHSVAVDPDRGFPAESGAFVGNVFLDDGVLELSLWTLARGASMTSRRASMASLKHTTLRVTIAGETAGEGVEANGPWFPSSYLRPLFEVFPDEPELALQFCHGLATQDRALALRDAAASFAFRYRMSPRDAELLVLAAETRGLWVNREVAEKRSRLSDGEKAELAKAVQESRDWLVRARDLGAEGKSCEEAEEAIERAEKQLASLE